MSATRISFLSRYYGYIWDGFGTSKSNFISGGVAELGLANVLGVFLVTLAGCVFAAFLAFCEFLIGAKNTAEEHGTTWVIILKSDS